MIRPSTTDGFDDVATWKRRDVQGSSNDDLPQWWIA